MNTDFENESLTSDKDQAFFESTEEFQEEFDDASIDLLNLHETDKWEAAKERQPEKAKAPAIWERILSDTGFSQDTDDSLLTPRQQKARLERRKRTMLLAGGLAGGLLVVLTGGILLARGISHSRAKKAAALAEQERLAAEATAQRAQAIADAAYTAAGYDYDGAIEQLKSLDGWEESDDIPKLIQDYEAAKDSLVPVTYEDVTHIFYHSLVVDTDLAFTGNDQYTAGLKQYMTTVTEFNNITQAMYDDDWVLVDIYDLFTETYDENGKAHFEEKPIYLPEGKKAFILSLDDLSYYHVYEGRGIATKLVLDEEGHITCEYTNSDGSITTGAFDCVPLLNQFMEAHPDGAYHNARGIIALTGYDGIFGYRTDIAYKTLENLDADQKVWLDAHPDFDWEEECRQATIIADELKAEGWTFASHTWGHIKIGLADLDRIRRDTEKWKSYVEPLIGETEMIIFANGYDLATDASYYEGNEKYEYLQSQGFNIYLNVDSRHYTMGIFDDFVHGGRRNLDGYRLWNDAKGKTSWTTDLFDASEMLDPARTDVPDI